MKKTQKKTLGFLGLVFVAATTAFAASLPSPGVSATSTLTDTIVVRVVGATALADILTPESGAVFTDPNQTLSFTYENLETVTATLQYTNVDGVERTFLLDSLSVDYIAGSASIPLNLAGENYGYGEYIATVSGEGAAGEPEEAISSFSYLPVVGRISEDKDAGEVWLNYTYDTTNPDIKNLAVTVYNEDETVAFELPLISVANATGKILLPLEEKGLLTGNYTVSISALDGDGDVIYKPYTDGFYYEDVRVPNTGSLFNNLNISKSDYLITGLIVFFLVGFAGLIYIARSKKSSKRR